MRIAKDLRDKASKLYYYYYYFLLLRLFSTETTDTKVTSDKDDEIWSVLKVCKLESQQPQLNMYI